MNKWLLVFATFLFISSAVLPQSFTFTTGQTTYIDTAGHFFDIYADLSNVSAEELNIRIIRTRSDMPADPGWFNALCNGQICYAPFTDTITVPDPIFGVPALGVDSTMEFHLNVGTDDFVPGTSFITVRAENMADTSDNVELAFTIITEDPSAIGDDRPIALDGFRLQQNFPNPFNPQTTIAFELPVASVVSLEIFDNLGRHIEWAFRETPLRSGRHNWEWDASDANGNPLASGVYYYRLWSDSQVQTRKMLLVR